MSENQLLAGRFRIDELIGRGGMGDVFRGEDTHTGMPVAIKHLKPEVIVDDPNAVTRFEREAEILRTLNHPNIVKVLATINQDDQRYIVMEYVEGGSLKDIMVEPLPVERVLNIALDIADALTRAHRLRIIHRDVKPANVLLAADGTPRLTDFGVAYIGGRSRVTEADSLIGTYAYISPEALADAEPDERADIWSFGVMLYEMLTGRLPFQKDTPAQLLMQILMEPYPKLSDLRPDIPPALERLVNQMLKKQPHERIPSVRRVGADLEDLMHQLTIGSDRRAGASSAGEFKLESRFATTTPPSSTQTARVIKSVRRSRWWVAGIGMLAVAIIAVMALVVVLNQEDEDTDGLKAATILLGETGTLADTIPTEAEITAAQRYVGDGFVGFIACNRSSEYHAGYARELVDAFDAYGLRLEIYDARNERGQQIPLIEQARSDGAAGLIICPLDINLLTSSLESIESAKLPLVLTHSGEYHYGGVAMGGDDYLLGLKPGQYAGQLIRDEKNGQADVIILDYPDLPNLVRRADGLEDGVLEFAPEANIIGRYLGGVADFARDSVKDLLDSGITFDVIVSINDAGSFGAIEALDDAGYDPLEVAVVSVDAEALAQEYIMEGYFMRASVALDRSQQTQAVANSMVKLLGGGTLPEVILTEPGDIVTRETLLQATR